jgi:hypothetical protein
MGAAANVEKIEVNKPVDPKLKSRISFKTKKQV